MSSKYNVFHISTWNWFLWFLWGRVSFVFFTDGYPIDLAPFIEKLILSALQYHLCHKPRAMYMYMYICFWFFSSPLVYLSVFVVAPHCHNCCNIIINLVIQRNVSQFFFSQYYCSPVEPFWTISPLPSMKLNILGKKILSGRIDLCMAISHCNS